MSERFKLIKIDDYVFQIHDTDNDVYLVAEQICKLLNELNEENKTLKKENEWLRKELKGLNKKYIAFSEATDKRLKEMMKWR